ncbi:integrase core domain-containing protein [Palleronia caenipelagi]|uniref:Transposase n=1 Tax=Palleronia caenipelagi TaxID=2489174 RepID=A0A547Q2S5_9RHOB|nr:transposase [Palleronia caenipelagi]
MVFLRFPEHSGGPLQWGRTIPDPSHPRENRSCESFHGQMRGDLLNGEIFQALREAQIILDKSRNCYDIKRPQSARASITCA